MNYLSKTDLLDLHAVALTHYGGRLGVKSNDVLAQVITAPRQTMFGDELYADLPAKAATMTFLLLKNRPFLSANQPTALLALLRMLAINGLALPDEQRTTELVQILRAIDRSRADRDALEAWIRAL